MIVIFRSPSIHRRHNETITTALKRTLISNLQEEAKDNENIITKPRKPKESLESSRIQPVNDRISNHSSTPAIITD